MSSLIPTLHDRRGFAEWDAALMEALSPEEISIVKPRSIEPQPSGRAEWAVYFKHRVHAYSTIICSIDDNIIRGLGAHRELSAAGPCAQPNSDPKFLYSSVVKFLCPDRAQVAQQIRNLSRLSEVYPKDKYSDITTAINNNDFLAYAQLCKICVDYDPTEENPILTTLLLDAIEKRHPSALKERVGTQHELCWDEVMDAIRPLSKQKKRDAPESTKKAKKVKTEK